MFKDGTTASNAYILRQVGHTSYIVQDTALSHAPEIVFMVNASNVSGGVGSVLPGQCYINATPFGGVAQPCSKIQQFRLSVFNADGSLSNYTWQTFPASLPTQATLVATMEHALPTNTVAPVASGAGVHGATVSVTNGTWVGDPTIVYTYQWLLNAQPIAGASSNTYVTTVAGTYSCNVIGTNNYGTSTATSNTQTMS